MPNINITLPETGQSITRPIVYDIISQIKEITKMDKDSKIFFPGDIQKQSTPGSSIDDKTDRFAIFNTNRYSFIDVEEDYDINTLGSTAVSRIEHPFIIEDRKLGLHVSPIYSTTNVKINFKYRCPSKTEVIKWRDDIRLKVSHNRDLNLHNITYHYLLPLEIFILLKEIHARRELTEPYNDTFNEYLNFIATDRLTSISDLVNNDNRLAISETQTRIIGQYDFTGIPEKVERDDVTGTYSISFSYLFTYEKPIACNIRYPIMVHNSLLSEQFTTFVNTAYNPDKVNKSFSVSLGALNYFETDSIINRSIDVNGILYIPSFDDYTIPSIPTGSSTVLMALCEVDKTDKKTLVNLKELGDIILDDDIIKFLIESEHPYLCKLYNSIIHVGLYRNDQLTNTNSIECDNLLNIKATSQLNLRDQHRIRISIITDITLLTREAIDRLKNYPIALVRIISSINELLRNSRDFVELQNHRYVSELDFNNLYRVLTGVNYANNKSNQDYYYNLINNTNTWTSRGNTLFGIDPALVERYRNNRIGTNTVQITGIISCLLNNP